MDRRAFFGRCGLTIARWTPALGLLGFRFRPYTFPNGAWAGWVEWCGRLVGFVRLNGEFFPFSK